MQRQGGLTSFIKTRWSGGESYDDRSGVNMVMPTRAQFFSGDFPDPGEIKR